jgi:hypothetical protein
MFANSVLARFAWRKVLVAIASWAVITFSTDVTWDGALLRGLIVAVGTAVWGVLDPNAEPFVGVKAKNAEVPSDNVRVTNG